MKEKTQPIYYCEYCNKKLFVKHAMARHEQRCKFNPANRRPCFNCCNFIKVGAIAALEYTHGLPSEGLYYEPVSVLYCALKRIHLHTPINDIKGNAYNLVEFEEDGSYIPLKNESMPLTCSDFNKPITK